MFEVNQILIDPGATLNLIPEKAVNKLQCIIHKDRSIIIRIANGTLQRLIGFVRFLIEVAGVRRIIDAFIVPGNTTYSLILGRPWLRSVKAIGLYERDEYWIQDQAGIHHQLEVSGRAAIKAPEVCLAQGVDVDELELDEETLIELEYSEEDRAKAIMEEIIAQTEEEMWRDYEEEVEAEEEEACATMSGKASR